MNTRNDQLPPRSNRMGAEVVCDLCGRPWPPTDVLVRRWTPENKALTLGFKPSEILCLTCAGEASA